MNIRRLIAASATAALLLPVSAVGAADGDCRDLFPADPNTFVEICEDQKFLVGAAGNIGNAQGITLTDTAPTGGDRTSGGMNVNVMPGATFVNSGSNSAYTHIIRGSFTGVIDELSANLYLTNPVDSALGASPSLKLRLTVDGVVLYDNFGAAAADTHSAAVTTVDTDLQIAHLHFTDLYNDIDADDEDDTHEVVLQVSETYYGDGSHVLNYGNAETPSTVTINPVSKTFASKIKV